MLQITPQAERHLLRLRDERGFDAKHGVRFLTTSGSVGMTFTDTPKPDDRVVEGTDLPVYVANDALAALDAATIDAKPEGEKTVLVIRRQPSPQAQPTNAN